MRLRVTVAADGFLDPASTPAIAHDLTFVPHGDLPAIRASLAGADALVTRRVDVTTDLLRGAPRLRLVQQVGIGTDRIDLAGARAAGVPVANTPGAVSVAVIEHTFLLVLARLRALADQVACIRRGGWSGPEVWEGDEIAGCTVGILGYGSIGRGLATRALAFDARVLVATRTPIADPLPGIECVDLPALLRRSDVLVVAASLTPQTRGLIGRAELALMKPSALLVNVARGAIIDEAALVEALDGGRLSGAALDAFTVEPLPAGPALRNHPRVLATPHTAGSSRQSRDRIWAQMRANLDRLARDEPLANVVN